MNSNMKLIVILSGIIGLGITPILYTLFEGADQQQVEDKLITDAPPCVKILVTFNMAGKTACQVGGYTGTWICDPNGIDVKCSIMSGQIPRSTEGCIPAGPEVCDDIDNDCNGRVDEGFDLLTDNQNCGLCGRSCAIDRSCHQGHCELKSPGDHCVLTVESCNNFDDDCDGQIDEDFDLSQDPDNCGFCGRVCAAGECCENGTCALAGVEIQSKALETQCDYRDDDGNGFVDDGIVLFTDWNNCGVCRHSCQEGQICENGYCTKIAPVASCAASPEECDGQDNDCDRVTDDGFQLILDNKNCGRCGNICPENQQCINGSCS